MTVHLPEQHPYALRVLCLPPVQDQGEPDNLPYVGPRYESAQPEPLLGEKCSDLMNQREIRVTRHGLMRDEAFKPSCCTGQFHSFPQIPEVIWFYTVHSLMP